MVKKIKIGNIEISPENGYFIQRLNNVGFTTKYSSATVLYMHGSVIGDSFINNKLINIELMIKGNDYDDLYNKKNSLYKEIAFGEGEDKIRLIFYLSNNDTVYIDAVSKSVDEDFTNKAIDAQFVRLSFETESAFFKSQQIYQVNIPITKGGGASVPMSIPLDMTQGESGFSKVGVGGNAISYPEIYFYGKLTNPILTNITTNQVLSFSSTTINSGDYIKIETENRIVIDNLGVNRRDEMSGDFIYLVVGNNEFRLATDISNEDGYVTLVYNNFYKAL